MHYNQTDTRDGKCEIVQYYNSTKSGVDTLDKLCRTYSSHRKCRRWPYGVFFSLVDCACIAAMRFPDFHGQSHYVFKSSLAKELCLPLMIRRSRLPKLKASAKNAMGLSGIPVNNAPMKIVPKKASTGRCHMCPRSRDTKQSVICCKCGNFICPTHRQVVCIECNQ